MTLRKDNFIESLFLQHNISRQKSSKIFEFLLEHIKSTLESGEDVLISGFGKFCVNEKKPRKGRNPSTGNALILDARRVVTFKCSDTLRKMVNKQ